MKRFKTLLAGLITLSIILAQCGTMSFAASAPTATKSLSLKAGKKATIKVKGSYIKSKTFKSTNTKVAKVNKKNGKVTAVKAGSCQIKITVKYYKTKKEKTLKKNLKSKVLKVKVTVKKAATAKPTPKPTAKPTTTPVPDDDPDDDIEYPEHDSADVAMLTQLIKEQQKAGAEIDDDMDSGQYSWSDTGRLATIDWEDCKLSGKLSPFGLTGLTELKCADNNLTSLDLSTNTALTDLDCHGNPLTKLDVSKNTLLEYVCCDEKVTVTGATSNCFIDSVFQLVDTFNKNDVAILTKIIEEQLKANPDAGIDTALDGDQYTWTDEGRLESISWRACDLSGSISLAGLPGLTGLSCTDNELLTSLDVSNCPALTTLECNSNQLKTLKVDKDTALEELYCQENQLTKLDIKTCKALTTLDCHSNKLTSLTISSNTLLAELDCSENSIKSLSLSKNTELNENDAVTCDEGTTISGHYITKDDEHTKEDCGITFVEKG